MKSITIEIKQNPSKDDAIKACIAWFDAENHNIGGFHYKKELYNYSEWACRKSNGEDVPEYVGIPQIMLKL